MSQKDTVSRRLFLQCSAAVMALAMLPKTVRGFYTHVREKLIPSKEEVAFSSKINGQQIDLNIDTRSSLLDVLREQLQLTGTKKGCDHGQCGACTVHINGQRVLSCLTLAATASQKDITTIEGLANGNVLHPMQEAFLQHEGYQCGYCTPGQIMSAVACVREGHASSISEIKEYMSGNICRCGAYNGICNAIKQVDNEAI